MDKLITLNNIKTLSKLKKVSMTTLEGNAKVSAGYVARLISDIENFRDSHEGKERPLPPTEVMKSFANDLGVTIDMLLELDYAGSNEAEMAVITFLTKLMQSTQKNQCIWKKVPSSAWFQPYDEFELFPLAQKVDMHPMGVDSHDKTQDIEETILVSLFDDKEIELEQVFRLDYKGKTFLIAETRDEGIDETGWHYCNYALELYSLAGKSIINVANSSYSSSEKTPKEAAMANLFSAVLKSAKVNPSGNDIVKMVQNYMKDMGFED